MMPFISIIISATFILLIEFIFTFYYNSADTIISNIIIV